MNNLLEINFSVDTACILLLVMGFILSVIGVFSKSFSTYGIISLVLYVLALIIEIVIGASIVPILYILVALLLIFLLMCVVSIRNVRFGKAVNSVWIQSATAVPQHFEAKNLELINKVGVTVSDCKPVGKIKINNVEYDAISEGVFLKRNVRVKVVKVEDNVIYIKECF